MGNESTDRHCEVCGREKKPLKRWIEITEKSDAKTGIDRVRQFVSDTMDGSDRNDHEDSPESSPVTDAKGYYEEIFYICPHLPCDGREETIRKIEHWRMKHDPDREISKERLDEIVAEKVSQEKSDHDIITEAVDEAHEEVLDDSPVSENKWDADPTDG